MLRQFSTLALAALLLASCTEDSTSPSTSTLTTSFSNLKDIGTNARYEGWLIVNGQPISTGVFTVNDQGTPSATTFTVNSDDLNNASAFTLTVEPFPDPDPKPSGIRILTGNFTGSSAAVSVNGAVADFASAKGTYILATPTDGNMDMNETSGVWWIDPSSGQMMPGFMLPQLQSGWTYEGWTVINGQALSTGKFNKVDSMDMSAMFSGSTPGPMFPGEDFLMGAPNGLSFPKMLEGMSKVVLTVEPVPDTDIKPFPFAPLAHDVPANAMARTPLMMNNQASMLPMGTVTR